MHQLGCLWDAQTLQHVNTHLVLPLDTSSGLFQPFPGGWFWEQGKDVHPGPSLGARNIRCEPPFPPPTSCTPSLRGCTPGHSRSGLNEQLAKKMSRFCYFFFHFCPRQRPQGYSWWHRVKKPKLFKLSFGLHRKKKMVTWGDWDPFVGKYVAKLTV